MPRFASITSDSRDVKKGSLFVAVRGESRDGHDFIDDVIAQGATAIIGERVLDRELPVPYTRVSDSRRALAELASEFYGHPSHSLTMIGVTGTSGKTTNTYLIESILLAAGFRVGVIGTVNYRYGDVGVTTELPSSHTTPGPVELQSLLAQMKKAGVTHVVMEVSSHALKLKRVAGVEFDATAFLNLSPEHLDFHKDMEDYFSSKKILFTDLFETAKSAGKKPVRVLNLDDSYGQRLAQEVKDVLTFGLVDTAMVSGAGLQESLEGITGLVRTPRHFGDQKILIESALMGRFNMSNIVSAIAVTSGLGIDSHAISTGIKRLKGVPGRLERVQNSKGIHVFVDYAHKPDALEKVLNNLQIFRGAHRLITVFGCGGDRDRSKRPVMGRIAQNYSDVVIVTSDNPRTENPEAIIQQIVAGMSQEKLQIEPNRRNAIRAAIRDAGPGDLVLIAGKGHEDYQIIGTQKHPFDDRVVAQEALKEV